MKLAKISGLLSNLKPSRLKQDTIAPELFNQMLATCANYKERKALYRQANSLRQDIVVLSVQKNKDQVFFDGGKCSSQKEFNEYIHDLLGTFVTYSKKNSPDNITQLKVSNEILIPPDKNTMQAISQNPKLSWM